jgi:hypothetical protein
VLNCVKKTIPSILFLAKSRSFAKQSHMKKIYLIVTLLSAVLLLQNCKKDTVVASATSTAILFADINDTTWNPTTISAGITYNAAAKTKVLNCTGTTTNQQVTFSVLLNNASNTPGFTVGGTYNVNTAGTVNFAYNILQNGAFVPQGSVAVGSGTIYIAAVDSVKKVLTGTFSFTSIKNNYDMSGNIISSDIAEVSQGAFNGMPYTFTSN